MPRIFYYCHRHQTPRGGQKHTYRHVDILTENGIEASVFHPGNESFRLTWFVNTTHVISESEFYKQVDPQKDFVVLPEDLGPELLNWPGKKIIFNKNVFDGFTCFGRKGMCSHVYTSREVVAAFVVSEHNRRILEYTFPLLDVYHVPLGISPEIFPHTGLTAKKPLIACCAKEPQTTLSVHQVLAARNRQGLNELSRFEWIYLEHYSERQVARILSEALLFLFFNYAEGLGRLPLEALASGCLVAGLAHGPLMEILPRESCFSAGDVVGIVQFVEKVMVSFPHALDQWTDLERQGYRNAAERSPTTQSQEVLRVWRSLLEDNQVANRLQF